MTNIVSPPSLKELLAKLKEGRGRNMIIVEDINNSPSNRIDHLNKQTKKINKETMKL